MQLADGETLALQRLQHGDGRGARDMQHHPRADRVAIARGPCQFLDLLRQSLIAHADQQHIALRQKLRKRGAPCSQSARASGPTGPDVHARAGAGQTKGEMARDSPAADNADTQTCGPHRARTGGSLWLPTHAASIDAREGK